MYFRRGTKMKLKLALAVFISALIVVFAWYYVSTGENPMTEIKNKIGSFVARYYEPKSTADRNENTQSEAKNTLRDNKTVHSDSGTGSATEDTARITKNEQVVDSVIADESNVSPADQFKSDLTSDASVKQELAKGNKPADHETGHITALTIRPNVQMMNALRSKDTITYNEGVLENVRRTFYREARPRYRTHEKFTVMFLHENGLNSAIWINIGTFQILAELGYRALAIDLPGHGNSTDVDSIPYSRDDILGYMTKLFTALQLDLPVLVSPSEGGKYAMPLLMTYPQYLRGLVAITPSDTSHYLISDYKKLTVPLLVMFGEKDDTMLKASSLDSLFNVPNRKVYMIRNTTHRCYVDHPPTFHKLLLQFLDKVKD